MYHQFNIHKFYVLPTQCIYVFCVYLRTNSHYFPIQHYLTGFYNRDRVFVYCAVWTGCLNLTWVDLNEEDCVRSQPM